MRVPVEVDYFETSPIGDIYVDGICDVELLGTNVRLIFYTWAQGERVVVCKLVQPLSAAGADVREMLAHKERTAPGAALIQ
jgi:hypothetical protein